MRFIATNTDHMRLQLQKQQNANFNIFGYKQHGQKVYKNAQIKTRKYNWQNVHIIQRLEQAKLN